MCKEENEKIGESEVKLKRKVRGEICVGEVDKRLKREGC